jgi:condensin complex subunit 1
MSCILASVAKNTKLQRACGNEEHHTQMSSYVVPQDFRDALACHLYMLYTIMIFIESEIKAGKTVGNTCGQGKGGKSQENESAQHMQNLREASASAMLTVTNAMAFYKSNLWKRSVPDENVISLPCRVAYQMLENSTGVTTRKLSSGDVALEIIAISLESNDCLRNTVVSALMDMMHSYEHMAPLVAELCCINKGTCCDSHDTRVSQMAIELLREIGRLDGNASSTSTSDTSGKANGIKNVAPFLSEIAEKKPDLVLEHIHLVWHHLNSEPYNLRSAIIIAIGHLLVRRVEADDQGNEVTLSTEHLNEDDEQSKRKKSYEVKEKLYKILLDHVYDVSSYTRATVLKTWSVLIEAQLLPTDKLIPVTKLAIDRLQDKTVMVRRNAMQVRTLVYVCVCVFLFFSQYIL